MGRLIKAGLIGFGTVGSGVYELIKKNRSIIAGRTGIDIEIAAICDTRADEVRKIAGGIAVTGDWHEIVSDPRIDIVIELIGGIEPARSIIVEALQNGKDVVTANKKLLAEAGEAIFPAAYSKGRAVGFEASVGGGIPCILALTSGLVGNSISEVVGILNGTTNYILTTMDEKGLTFETALKGAQELGFAEADPTFDIEGYDAAHKTAIVAMLAFNRRIDYASIRKEGITRISDLDIRYAREMGYVIKLLGIAKQADGEIDIRVHPTMLHHTHPLASVRNEFNAVMFVGDMTGPVTLTGKGAGSLPTASAVVSDIVRIARNGSNAGAATPDLEEANYLPPEKRLSRYYMRVHVEDSPGILSKISGVLGKNNISIASVMQKEQSSAFVPLVIMTHRARESGILASIEEMRTYSFIENITLIRVEDSFSIGADNE